MFIGLKQDTKWNPYFSFSCFNALDRLHFAHGELFWQCVNRTMNALFINSLFTIRF